MTQVEQPAVSPGEASAAPPERPEMTWRRRFGADWPWLLLAGAAILASFAVRVYLIRRGGLLFWPDEQRYMSAGRAWDDLLQGGWISAWRYLYHAGDHVAFRAVSLVPVAISRLVGGGIVTGAICLSLSGLACLWLTGWLAAELGAPPAERALAVVAMAVSTSMTYWSRHLVPYDLAMSLALLGAIVAIRRRRWMAPCLAGLCAGSAFAIYSGYWALAGLAMVLATVDLDRFRIDRYCFLRAGLCLAGFALPVAAIALTTWQMLGVNHFEALADFAGTAVQGSFDEGWRLPWAYLFETEGWLLPVWLGAAGWAAWRFAAGEDRRRLGVYLGGLLFLYGCLALTSTLLHQFVVYGRTSRLLVPFLALPAAYAAARIRARFSGARWPLPALLSAGLLIAVLNLAPHCRQIFPLEFAELAKPEMETFIAANRQRLAGRRYIFRIVNADFYHPYPERLELPPHETIYAAPHPLSWRTYLYEGYSPDQRHAFLDSKLTMKLIVYPEIP